MNGVFADSDFFVCESGAPEMSKRERAEKPKGEAAQAKVVKTKEPEESASIRDVGAFVAELASLAGPDLLLAIRKVRRLGANAVFFFLLRLRQRNRGLTELSLQALNAPDLFTFGEVSA
jgi:hypothetical protein